MTAPLGDLLNELAYVLRSAAAGEEIELQVAGRMLLAPTPPSIDIWVADPSRDNLTAAFQEVGGEYILTVRARVGTVDNLAGQDLLLRLLDDEDPIGVAATLQEDQTLNGLASSVYVDLHSGYQLLEGGPDGTGLLGCTWRVRVLRVTS